MRASAWNTESKFDRLTYALLLCQGRNLLTASQDRPVGDQERRLPRYCLPRISPGWMGRGMAERLAEVGTAVQ